MTIFRVPLNALVVIGTRVNTDTHSMWNQSKASEGRAHEESLPTSFTFPRSFRHPSWCHRQARGTLCPSPPHILICFFVFYFASQLEQTATLPTVFTVAAVWFGLSCVFQSALAGWADGKRDTLQDAAVKQAKNGNGNGKKYK